MDLSNDGRGRISLDAGSARLTKKRSNARNTTHNPPRSSTNITPRLPLPSTEDSKEGGRSRKSTIRDAVKKIFGRRPKTAEASDPVATSPPRHGYHASEPAVLSPQPEQPEIFEADAGLVRQSEPNPLRSAPPMHFPRISSPSSGAFPNSVKLKPLDLGRPQVRRRKTLPNVQLTELEAASLASSPLAAPPIPVGGSFLDNYAPAVSSAKTAKAAKRRSRSADNLYRSATAAAESSPRNRNDEIRFWRESFRPDVLGVSGFRDSVAPLEQVRGGVGERKKTPVATDSNPFEARPVSRPEVPRNSPPFHHGPSASDADIRSASGIGTELSRELEDRVAKLEAGLHTFQRSLLRLTAERNRRTVIVGGEPNVRSPQDSRSPSMLADTLSGIHSPSSYELEYGYNTRRPRTTPHSPLRPAPRAPQPLDDPFGLDVPQAAATNHRESEARTSRPREDPRAPPVQLPNNSSSPPEDHMFHSLYQMLAEERSARRRLESQVVGLQQEMSDLSTQVVSPLRSQRSSYLDTDPGRSRLRDLLRDTESSPPANTQSPQQRRRQTELPVTTSTGAPMISRFSNSESEAGATEYEELETPMEAYQTPREALSMYNLRENGHERERIGSDDGDDMFW